MGAGNFIRGQAFSEKSHIPRNTADYMGMLSTIINACALQETLEKLGPADAGDERDRGGRDVRALHSPAGPAHFERGRVVILAGGTAIPSSPQTHVRRCGRPSSTPNCSSRPRRSRRLQRRSKEGMPTPSC